MFGLIAVIAFFAMSCQNAPKNEQKDATSQEEVNTKNDSTCCDKDTVKPCCLSENNENILTVDKVLADLENLASKDEITVCGKTEHICARTGKRLFLSTGESEDVLVVTIEEEEFDKNLLGQNIIVTGKLVMKEIKHEHSEGEEDDHHHDDLHENANEKVYALECRVIKPCVCNEKKESAKNCDSENAKCKTKCKTEEKKG